MSVIPAALRPDKTMLFPLWSKIMEIKVAEINVNKSVYLYIKVMAHLLTSSNKQVRLRRDERHPAVGILCICDMLSSSCLLSVF